MSKQSDPIWGNGVYDNHNLSMASDEIARLKSINGVEASAPVVYFENQDLLTAKRYEHELDHKSDSNFSKIKYESRSGKKRRTHLL